MPHTLDTNVGKASVLVGDSPYAGAVRAYKCQEVYGKTDFMDFLRCARGRNPIPEPAKPEDRDWMKSIGDGRLWRLTLKSRVIRRPQVRHAMLTAMLLDGPFGSFWDLGRRLEVLGLFVPIAGAEAAGEAAPAEDW